MLELYQAKYPAPFAVLGVRTTGNLLIDIDYLPRGVATLSPLNALAENVCRQIERYLDDPGFRFDLPFEFNGSEFQRRVWRAICKIPSGGTCTYRDIARRLATAPRPVGGACGANRIPIVIPCHRVVGSNGIGGFMKSRGGFPIEIKQWLLKHEAVKPPMNADER
ncbi:MAG: methylated-DNA--[protein]-cysteine S-methyltransferase [Pseudomonadota bacterium]